MSTSNTSTGDRLLGLLLLAGANYGYKHSIAKPEPVPLSIAPPLISSALPDRLVPAPLIGDTPLTGRPKGLGLLPGQGSKAKSLLLEGTLQAPRPVEGLSLQPRLPKLSAGGLLPPPSLTDSATFRQLLAIEAAKSAPPTVPTATSTRPVAPTGDEGWMPFPKVPGGAAPR